MVLRVVGIRKSGNVRSKNDLYILLLYKYHALGNYSRKTLKGS